MPRPPPRWLQSPTATGPTSWGREPGTTISVQKLSELAHAWWEDRLSADWRPHTRDGNQAILDRLGLTCAFWRLP